MEHKKMFHCSMDKRSGMFVGTNLNPLWERFLISSQDDCGGCQDTAGNGAVVETSDQKILVLERSNNVGEFPVHYVFPGGHPEHDLERMAMKMPGSHQGGHALFKLMKNAAKDVSNT